MTTYWSDPSLGRWLGAVAQGRALALNALGVHPNEPWVAAGDHAPGDLFEFLLGLRPTLRMHDGVRARRLKRVTRALNFRLAAQITWVDTPTAPIAVNTSLARAAVAALHPAADRAAALTEIIRTSVARADTHYISLLTSRYRPMRSEEWAALDGARLPRVRLAPQRPVLVLSSAGRPADVRKALLAYLPVIRDYGHQDLTLVLADDAASLASAVQLEALAAEATDRHGIEVVRFSEWRGDGCRGVKHQFRDRLLQRLDRLDLPRHDVEAAGRTLAPGLPGTANAVFARFAGRDLLWLEEDAIPFAVDSGSSDSRDMVTNTEGERVLAEHMVDLIGDSGASRRHPVDFPHIVDRCLHATDLEALPFAEQTPTYEDAGFERVSGAEPEPHGAAGMVHFHTCGEVDYRARLSHRFVMNEAITPEDRAIFLKGGMPLQKGFTEAPPTVSLRQWTSAFGTVVGFSGQALLRPLTMWASKVRLGDFAVGQLARFRGLTGCVAGTALEHHRGDVTDSGRGELASYLVNEELLWPLLRRTGTKMAALPQIRDYPQWLLAVGESLRAPQPDFIVPPALAHSLHAELNEDLRQAERSTVPALRDYAMTLRACLGAFVENPWIDYHAMLERQATAEVVAYAAQLRVWSRIVSSAGAGE
ncbi:hypothetical protein [Streptomyces sp. NPDC088270]|uniref:hypothetical protein n=1 Tax=Streptomyces sp. NPDC088270 TaxID=3160990 RepID=UPI003434E101